MNPGTVLVQARPVEGASGKVTQASPNSWYVLNDDPVLSGEDINNPRQGLFNPQQGLLNTGEGTGQPDVVFGFSSSHGQMVFERLTREIAQRGINAQLPGVPKARALQHFAVVLDGQVITAPSIDYTQYPEGIDATHGSQITGSFTLTFARELARRAAIGLAADQARTDLLIARVRCRQLVKTQSTRCLAETQSRRPLLG